MPKLKTLRCEFNEIGQCFGNVQDKVKVSGGRARSGWIATRALYGLIQTWNHHCAWENPDGELFDLTPQLDTNGNAMFLPDAEFVPDDAATLIQMGEMYRVRLPKYTALKDQPKLHEAIICLERADEALQNQDFEKEAYWCRKASRHISPDAALSPWGLKGVLPLFSLPA